MNQNIESVESQTEKIRIMNQKIQILDFKLRSKKKKIIVVWSIERLDISDY
jgi:hypothetical protein